MSHAWSLFKNWNFPDSKAQEDALTSPNSNTSCTLVWTEPTELKKILFNFGIN